MHDVVLTTMQKVGHVDIPHHGIELSQVGQGYPHDAPKVKCETQVCHFVCLVYVCSVFMA